MHVLMIPQGIYTLPQSILSGIFEQHQAEVLRDAGLKVGVLSGGVITARHLGKPFPYSESSQVNGIPVYRAHRRAFLPARWETPDVAAARTYARLVPVLRRYLSEVGRPDIIHAHNFLAGGLVARRIAETFGIPYIITEHTGPLSVANVRADAPLIIRAAERARAVVAVSSQLAETLHEGLADALRVPVVVVPNVVDPVILESPLVSRRSDRPFTVMGLGSLEPDKNYQMLVRAFARAGLPLDAQLVVGGSGPESNRLLEIARSEGILDRFSLLGHLDRDAVSSAFARADLFAHPSNGESFGVVLIEALASGLPVVATACGGPQDIVTTEVGRLTPVGDVDMFAAALTELYERRSQFEASNLRRFCSEHFGSHAFADKMVGIYRTALA